MGNKPSGGGETATKLVLRVKSRSLKAALLKKIVSNYKYRLGGFITEEMREKNRLDGFIIKTVDGRGQSVLASRKIVSPVVFNKYAVNLSALEKTALDSMRETAGRVLIIDEVGSIALKSAVFMARIAEILVSDVPAVIVIREGAEAFGETLGRLDNAVVLELRAGNYYDVEKKAENWIEYWIREGVHVCGKNGFSY